MTACDNGQSDGRGQGRDAERPTVVALGDSLTTPVGSGSDQDWWQAADPSGQFDLIATAGVGGQRTDEILARVERDVIAHDPDWATVLAGTNDIGQGIDALTTIANLTSIFDTLADAGIRIVAITIPPMVMLDPAELAAHEAVNAWLRDEVEGRWDARLADWNAALSVDGDGVSPRPEFFPDGIHFSRAGAAAAGAAIAPVFAEIADRAG